MSLWNNAVMLVRIIWVYLIFISIIYIFIRMELFISVYWFDKYAYILGKVTKFIYLVLKGRVTNWTENTYILISLGRITDWDRVRCESLAKLRLLAKKGRKQIKSPHMYADTDQMEEMGVVDLQKKLVVELVEKHKYEREVRTGRLTFVMHCMRACVIEIINYRPVTDNQWYTWYVIHVVIVLHWI